MKNNDSLYSELIEKESRLQLVDILFDNSFMNAYLDIYPPFQLYFGMIMETNEHS